VSVPIVETMRRSWMRTSAALLGLLLFAAVQSAHAEIGMTATSEQAGYVRGQTNTFVFHLALFSNVFELADNIHFGFPPGVTISAARYIDEGKTNCPDALLLVLGMGRSDGGWFNPGHPSGCGHFVSASDGTPQVFSIDADIPAGYFGDLPVLISVEGDGCCDPPPHEASVTLTLAEIIGSTAPSAAVGPDKLSASLDAGAHRNDTLSIGNVGGGALDYAVTTASADANCSTPSNVPWLHVAANGTVTGGEHVDLPLRIDADGLAVGSYAALVCVATSDGATLAMPVSLRVTSGPCAFADRLLANGFDDASDGSCGESVRTFTRRDAFLFQTAAGYAEDRYTGLRTGRLNGPIVFGNGTFDYSVFTQDGEVNALFLVGGSGVLSGTVPANHVALTFTGAPVTAFGANVWGTEFFTNSVPETTIVLSFDDGSSDTFTSGSRDTFRGFVTTLPMHGVSVSAPDLVNGDLLDAVFDNVVAGRAR
jgi:hypothetical protein